ncbi:MAG: zinc metalloprotease HtpX [Candidatus Paceibacterota bacterium]|jgi:heat shock protein HtpX
MATLYNQQDNNIRRTWFLMATFFGLIIAIGWAASYYYHSSAILYVAVVFSLVMNFVSYWWSDKIVLSMAGAKPLEHDQAPEIYHLVENLAITAGLPTPKIYLIEDPVPNAFATGRNKEHAVVALTSGLVQTLNKNELEGVIAHELSHIGNRDILLQTVVVTLVGFISILADMFTHSLWFGGSRDSEDRGGGVIVLVGIVLSILSPLVATVIQLAISRRREFLADASGALLTRYPEGLASALEKISRYNQPLEHASNATAHLYISNPFGAGAVKGMAKLFMTHPPAEERIQALRGMSF